MIAEADVSFYRENGYLVVPDVLSPAELDAVRRVTDELVAAAAGLSTHTDVYDLEDSHRSGDPPRVRRIKAPHRLHPEYSALVRHPGIVEVLRQLLSPSLRFDTSKLNLKAAGYGAPVEWHQDWAFYPHTNDDLAAVGVLLDDCGDDNGPLQVIAGSHRGPVHDHHRNGFFCGAIADSRGIDVTKAAALTGTAGSITIHHVRAVHGSAPNRSARERRLLLHQYAAADAWPLLGVDDFASWKANQLTGDPCVVPRLADVPVRLPLPPAEQQGSIYENQRGLGGSFWEELESATPAAGPQRSGSPSASVRKP